MKKRELLSVDSTEPNIVPVMQKGARRGSGETISRAADLSIQDRATKPDDVGGGVDIFANFVRAGTMVAPWWSFQRDRDLRKFWIGNDYVAGTMFATCGKVANMGWKIIPKDRTVNSQVQLADFYTKILRESPEYGKGWMTAILKFALDLQSTDNGAFMEVIGGGDPTGPIIGAPVSLAHLDSNRCTRTSNPIYPVVYTDTDSRRYKLHYTRVIFASQMPSADVQMNDVGLSAVSRCIDNAQVLNDLIIYKQEKMGSRPPRGILVGEKGITAQEIMMAFQRAEEMDDTLGFEHFRRMVAIAPKQGRGEISLSLMDLASLPDGFDERNSVELGIYAIALGFGVDVREIWPATVSGATKADAMIQHLKARGKGIGQILTAIETQINQKFLPDTLIFQFDLQDDEQDALRAEVQDKRSIRHERDHKEEILTTRAIREIMLDDGDITEAQFEEMELKDGRLRDGTGVLALFFSPDPLIKKWLNLGVDNPLAFIEEGGGMRMGYGLGEREGNFGSNRTMQVLKAIESARMKVQKDLLLMGWSTQKQKARQCLAALDELERKWKPQPPPMQPPQLGRPPQQIQADQQRRRNEDDFRGDGEITAARAAIGEK